MRGKIYKYLRKFCSIFGVLGAKIQSWAEFKEWKYWNDQQLKIIEIPDDIHVFLYYNRKGDFLRINVNYWPMIDGSYDWNRPHVFDLDLTKEKIQLIATKEVNQDE